MAPDPLVLQVGSGDPGNLVGSFLGVDVIIAGQPGHLHFVAYSTSDLPSSHPLCMLDIGNNWSELYFLPVHGVEGKGWNTWNEDTHGITFTTFYAQSVNLSVGYPLPVSNLQEIFVAF